MTKYYIYIYKSTNIYTRVPYQTTHTHTPSHMHVYSMHKYTCVPKRTRAQSINTQSHTCPMHATLRTHAHSHSRASHMPHS